MGKKDVKLKTYFQDAVRYADLWNGGVFKGKQVICAEELHEITPVRSWAESGLALEKNVDLVMKQNYDGQRFALLALENQEKIDYGMPVRVMIQEALEYEKQMKNVRQKNEREYKAECKAEGKKRMNAVYKDDGEYLYKVKRDDRLSPVVTLVVYWGEEEWKGAKSLHEMIDFSDTQAGEELRKLIPEYPLHFLDLSQFTHFEYFKTELRPLLELFQKRNNKEEFAEYIRENEGSSNMDEESWNLLDSLIDSKNVKKLIKRKEQKNEEEENMCNALDALIAEAKAEFVVNLLEEYGEVPADLRETIMQQTDEDVLRDWLKLAARMRNVEEFAKRIYVGV